MVVQRGEIWWAELGIPRGSEPGFDRPILVVQSDNYNRSEIHTVIVAAITTNLRLADMPGNLRLPNRSTGLAKPSVLNVTQLMTLDKSRLKKKVRLLSKSDMDAVDLGIRLVLALPH